MNYSRSIISRSPSLLSLVRLPCFARRCFSAEHASASAVKKLRGLSGAPLMDCKAALLNASVQGDMQKALDWLRAKGIAKATSANRETKEGLIGLHYDIYGTGKVTIVEVNCETDFVAMNTDFQSFVALVSQTVHQSNLSGSSSQELLSGEDILSLKTENSNSTLQQKLGDIISTIRENIVVKRAKTVSMGSIADKKTVNLFSTYVHGKINNTNLPSNVQVSGRQFLLLPLSRNCSLTSVFCFCFLFPVSFPYSSVLKCLLYLSLT
jgi:translation elongation factor EF-Ts